MPDRTTLKVGDRIRLLRVPESDVLTRQREIADRVEDAGRTADTIERILREDPVVVISEIDEHGNRWFEWTPRAPLFAGEVHSLTVIDDESWERA